MKKIPRYTGISQYLRYHNLHSIIQWNVHYSRTLQTSTAQRKLDENPRTAGKKSGVYLTLPAKNYANARAQFTHTGFSGGTGLNYHS